MSSRRRRSGARPDRAQAAHRVAPATAGLPVALAIFALALGLQLLHWRADPGRNGAASADYPGDSGLWLDWASAIHRGEPYELGLPLHPPGTAFLVSLLWDGDVATVASLRVFWCLMAALAAAFVTASVVPGFGRRVALVVGIAFAGTNSLLQLGNSIDSETPYLVLVFGSFLLHERLREAPPPSGTVALWALLQAVACLFRIEHALYVALAVVAWGIRSRRALAPRIAFERAGLATAVAIAVLAPWQIDAGRAVSRLNRDQPASRPGEAAAYAAIERRVAALRWEEPAQRWRERLPAFARRSASLFVAATALHRGRPSIGDVEVRALDEAFGLRPSGETPPLDRIGPRPLPSLFFVSLYGPLNFALANHSDADGGFSTRVLERPPRLAGGAARYPPDLVAGLPPPELSLAYPPHVELLEAGYAVGGRWIAGQPASFARLAARKLDIFWSGAASGFGGWNVPIGLAEDPRAVDMRAPRPFAIARLWQIAVLALAATGLVRWRRSPWIVPWILFVASKVAVTILFFGYARQGALIVPAVALGAALALRGTPARSR